MRLGEEMRVDLGLGMNGHLEFEGVESEDQSELPGTATYSALILCANSGVRP